MNHELLAILEYIEQERGISKSQLVEAVEKALLSASRKSISPAAELEVKVDRASGDIRAWAMLEVVDGVPNNDQVSLTTARTRFPDAKVGEKLRWEVTPKNFGRIAAQTAKQAILQQIRKAEKETVFDEFRDKVGEIVNGTVRRFENGGILVDLQKTEGMISAKDKVPGEQYMIGDRINALLVKLNVNEPGPCLVLSRTSPNFIRKLFEREVSEIHDGVVEIVSIVREAGSRTKIAVKSSDPRIDPVGACVGMRGMRVKNITNELGGERVDIIEYSDDTIEYVTNALHPARANKIEIKKDTGVVIFHVNSENSRLAFGKKAQNVRLAQKLTGLKIDIKTDEENEEKDSESFEEQKAIRTRELSQILNVSLESAEKLVANGYLSVEGLRAAAPEDLRAISGITEDDLARIMSAVEQ